MLLSTPLQQYIQEHYPQLEAEHNSCSEEFLKHGMLIMKIDGKPDAVEILIRSTASILDLKLDWYYDFGIAQVLLLGDINDHIKAYNFLNSLIKDQLEFDYLQEFDNQILDLIKDEACYQKEISRLSPDDDLETITVVVESIDVFEIERAFNQYEGSNERQFHIKKCIPPLDDIFTFELTGWYKKINA